MRVFNETLTADTLQEEYLAWSRDKSRGKTQLRFGQHICNKYLKPGQSAPEIFYTESLSDAHWLIVDDLIKQEN